MSYVRIRHYKNILWLVLDRPPLNILSIEMLDQLTAAMRDAIKNAPRLIVITGAGKAFILCLCCLSPVLVVAR